VAARWCDLTSPTFAGNTVSINYKPYFQGGVFPNSAIRREVNRERVRG